MMLLFVLLSCLLPRVCKCSVPSNSFAFNSRSLKNVQLQSLSETAANLLTLQTERNLKETKWTHYSVPIITLMQREMWPVDQKVKRLLFKLKITFNFESHLIDDAHPYKTSLRPILDTLEKQLDHYPTVVVFFNGTNTTSVLIDAVCSAELFKWTHLLHSSEWILVSSNTDFLNSAWNEQFSGVCFDYFTIIISSETDIRMARKYRTHSSEDVARLTFSSSISWSMEDIRRSFSDLSLPKVIGLQGMTLPVGILESDKKISELQHEGNNTVHTGYAIGVLDLLAAALKFQYTLVKPSPGEFYGAVLSQGNATGLTGQLARKEIALCTMPMSRTVNRLKVMDFSDVPLQISPIFITYKLPTKDNHMDKTLVDIVHPDFVLSLLGPLLIIAMFGALTHVITGSCSTAQPRLSLLARIRSLTSYPDHLCFHVSNNYPGQTGRVLRGSWAVFCIIVAAAYSAYLVTNFTVKPKELKLDTLEKLLENEDFMFGVFQVNSALLTALRTSPDPILQRTWDRIVNTNRSDPSVLSELQDLHISRIVTDNYALLDHSMCNEIAAYAPATSHELRNYHVSAFDDLSWLHIGMPKNAFFKDAINRLLHVFDETGVLEYLRDKYNVYRPGTCAGPPPETENKSVTMSRIFIVVIVALCATAPATVCLLLECLYSEIHRRRKKMPRIFKQK